MVVTELGYFGTAPAQAEIGDVVVIFHGVGVPYILREVGSGEHVLVGDCYLHGVMDGEIFDQASKSGGGLQSSTFVIK